MKTVDHITDRFYLLENLLFKNSTCIRFSFIKKGHQSAGIRNERNILLAYLKKQFFYINNTSIEENGILKKD